MSQQKHVTILDGGMSRELMRLKAPFQSPEWTAYALMKAPHLVKQVHSEFAAAGAEVLTTNSYALVPYCIGEERFTEQGAELITLAGQLARTAADEEHARSGRKVLVAGSLPPIFGSYEPQLFDASRVQGYLSVLVQNLAPYVDFWLGETLSLISEATAVQEAVKSTGKPFWIAFTIQDKEAQTLPVLRSGESVREATEATLASGAEALLFNCSQPEFMAAAVRAARTVVDQSDRKIPVGVYANTFVDDPENKNEYGYSAIRGDLGPQRYADIVSEWVAEGATIIGGCCGVGCDHIRLLSETLAPKVGDRSLQS